MAETRQELKTDEVKKKKRSTRNDWLREWQVQTGQKLNSGKPARKGGAEQLRRAADKQVGKNSAKLADKLTEKALAGDLASTKVLITLAEAKKPDAPKKRRGPTPAQWLAAQPQWEGSLEDDEEEED